MGWNGSGTFASTTAGIPVVTATVTSSTVQNAWQTELDTGLTNCIAKDGQSATTAMIPFAFGLRVSNGTAASPSLAFINQTDAGFYRIGANNIGFAIAGVKVWDAIGASVTLSQDLLFTDATYDIGKSAATRPRDIFLSRNATIGNLTATRLTYAGTAGLLSDSANLTWSSPALTIGVAGTATGALKLTGATSGTVTITPNATAGTWTLELPATGGTANFALTTNGSGVASWVSGQSIAGLLTTSTPQFARLGLGAAADASNLLQTSAGSFVNSAGALSNGVVGPHALGGATDGRAQLLLTGSFSGNSDGAYASHIVTTLNPAANKTAYTLNIANSIVEAASGVHSELGGINVQFSVTNGAATATDNIGVNIATWAAASGTTNATGLRVAAPTGATNNYAINVTSGDIYKAGTAYNNPAWVFEHYYHGEIKKFADRFGAIDYAGLPSIHATEDFCREMCELPQMARFKHGGMFDRGDMLLASVEQAFLYLFQHEARLLVLEKNKS